MQIPEGARGKGRDDYRELPDLGVHLAPDNALILWVAADDIRNGAATNAVQIAEILADKYLSWREPVSAPRLIA